MEGIYFSGLFFPLLVLVLFFFFFFSCLLLGFSSLLVASVAFWLFWLLWLFGFGGFLASVAFWLPAPPVFLAAFEPFPGPLETVTPHSANG